MIRCETVGRWLPWYASGQISTRKMQRMADHIAGCETCQAELAHVVQLRHRYTSTVLSAPLPTNRIWEALSNNLEGVSNAQIDVGSFLIGLNVGFATKNRGSAVQGDLRVLGRKVRVIGKQRKGA